MPNVAVYDMSGSQIGEIALKDEVFGVKINKTVLHMSVVNYLANQRQGTQSTLTRAEVRGGGAKPWRQKGTGRARQGSIRSPQWIHGGIALGPKPRDYRYSLNKKVKRIALLSALSSKVADGQLIVIDNIALEAIKTKAMIGMLKSFDATKTLILTSCVDEKIVKSAANIPFVKTTLVNTINAYDILKYEKLIVTKDAITKLEEVYA